MSDMRTYAKTTSWGMNERLLKAAQV